MNAQNASLAFVPSQPARPSGLAATALAASIVAVGLACRELLRFEPRASLSGEAQDWLFEPSGISPAVVVLFSGWLLWRRRRRLAALWGRGGSAALTAGLWLAAAAIFGWAVRSGAPDLQALALAPALLGAASLFGGTEALRVVAVPAAVLLLALPIPAPLHNELLWRLQLATADTTALLLQALGTPVLVSGDRLFAEGRAFVIIESCAGLRSIETLALLGVLMVELFGRRGAHAALLLAATPAVAFAINGLRCVGLVLNPHAEIAAVHNVQGVAMLLAGVLVLYGWDVLLGRLLPERRPPSAPECRSARAAPRARLGPPTAALAGFAGGLLAFSALPPFAPPELTAPRPGEVLPAELDGWRASPVRTDWMFLASVGFEQAFQRRFARGEEFVDVFVGQADLADRLRSHVSAKTGVPGSGWEVEARWQRRLAGREVTLRALRQGRRRVVAAHWYEAGPGLAAESVRALLALDAGPLRRRRVPAVVRLATPHEGPSYDAAERRLERVAPRLVPFLEAMTTPR